MDHSLPCVSCRGCRDLGTPAAVDSHILRCYPPLDAALEWSFALRPEEAGCLGPPVSYLLLDTVNITKSVEGLIGVCSVLQVLILLLCLLPVGEVGGC